MKFIELLTETIIYHGDNFNTRKLDIELMNNGNNQEGIGIYFGSEISIANAYGSNIVSAVIKKSNFVDSRAYVEDVLNRRNLVKMLNSLDKSIMYDWFTDYGLEHYDGNKFAEMLGLEQVRNLQVDMAERFGVKTFVNAWNKFMKIDGTYSDQGNGKIWYAVINPKISVDKV